MLELTESEIEALIENHHKNKNKPKDRELHKEAVDKEPMRSPVYSLKDILGYGLTYLYAKEHLREGKVMPCEEKFSIFKKHSCEESTKFPEQQAPRSYKSSFAELSGIQEITKARDSLRHCWIGHNLAILTSDFNLQGYFKRELLFQKRFENSSIMIATFEKIYIGLCTGEIVYFDPIGQNEKIEKVHTDLITSLCVESGNLLSSSMDGTIFYKKSIYINSQGVLAVKLIADDKFVCSCEDNTIALHENGDTKFFGGHKNRIKSLTYDKVAVSTSLDGVMGVLSREGAFETTEIGCSHHKRVNAHQIVGYGKSEIVVYDVSSKHADQRIKETTQYLDVHENTVAYTRDNRLRIRDMRSNDTIEVPLRAKGRDLSFSELGDMVLVCTDDSPFMVDLKYI